MKMHFSTVPTTMRNENNRSEEKNSPDFWHKISHVGNVFRSICVAFN